MEFKEFCKLKKRMCESYKYPTITECCPIEFVYQEQCNCDNCDKFCFEHSEEIEEIVEKWAAENPIQTNYDMLVNTFGKRIADDIAMIKNVTQSGFRKWLDKEYILPESE